MHDYFQYTDTRNSLYLTKIACQKCNFELMLKNLLFVMIDDNHGQPLTFHFSIEAI
jgi:hypothetical protein